MIHLSSFVNNNLHVRSWNQTTRFFIHMCNCAALRTVCLLTSLHHCSYLLHWGISYIVHGSWIGVISFENHVMHRLIFSRCVRRNLLLLGLWCYLRWSSISRSSRTFFSSISYFWLRSTPLHRTHPKNKKFCQNLAWCSCIHLDLLSPQQLGAWWRKLLLGFWLTSNAVMINELYGDWIARTFLRKYTPHNSQ